MNIAWLSRFVRSQHGLWPKSKIFATMLFLSFVFSPTILRAADATFSLPLQGHYRLGRYMPVRVSAQMDSAGDPLTLRATGALTTRIDSANGRIDGIVPWLSIRTIHDVRWSTAAGEHSVDLPLTALDEDDRLIGYAGADPDVLTPWFPGKKLIRVPLDITNPLPGEITAWESLDGVVLDAAAARRMTEAAVRSLLAGGTAIAIRSAEKPGGGWAWQRQGTYWIARVDSAGPTSAYVPAAYEPTQTWLRGWPMALRRQVVLAALVFMILATAAALWRSRWAVAVVVILCAIATGCAFLWRHRQSSAIEVGGSIVVVSNAFTQRDDWEYRAVLRESAESFKFQPLSRPVFGYRGQVDELNAIQLCSSDGNPLEFRYRLMRRQSIAFQTRHLTSVRETLSSRTPISSPLRTMADQLYALKNDRLIGQRDGGTESRWADVVIERPSMSVMTTEARQNN